MNAPTLTAEPLSRIRPERVNWLWESYIPRGKLTILDGDPEIGKSLLSIDLAARLSRGTLLPDGKPPTDRPHVTIFLSAEDKAADTIRPRVEAAGGDLEQFIIPRTASNELPRFPEYNQVLEELIRETKADLVAIDPIVAFLPHTVSASSDQCVRRPLSLLAGIAERTDCAILLIRHLRKQDARKALHRGLGSIGIIGSVRMGLLAAIHPTQPDLRVLAVSKTNLASKPPALGYRIIRSHSGEAVIAWSGAMDVTADALGLPGPAPLKPRDRAAEWLSLQLQNGPRPATEIYAEAAACGIPDRTLERAKSDLGVRSHQVMLKDDTRIWYWFDPAAPWPKDTPFKRPFMLEPL